MLRFNNFLCCLKLETGGYVIGYLAMILNGLSLISLLLATLFLCLYSCEDIAELLKEKHMNEDQQKIIDEHCPTGKTILIVVFIFAALFVLAFAVIGFMCVVGTMKRNHNKVKPMVILLAVATICAFINILSFTSTGIVSGLFNGLLYGYFFVCIYSLFYNFREEFERGFNSQYRVQVAKA